MTLTEAEEKALKILKQVMEEKVNSTNVEACTCCIIFDNVDGLHDCLCVYRWHQLKLVASLKCMKKKN